EMQAYLRYVRAEAKHGFDAGLPALEAARRIDLGPYAGWTQPERILFQVERAYRELRGEPYDAPIDVTALFRGMHALRESRRAVAPGEQAPRHDADLVALPQETQHQVVVLGPAGVAVARSAQHVGPYHERRVRDRALDERLRAHPARRVDPVEPALVGAQPV